MWLASGRAEGNQTVELQGLRAGPRCAVSTTQSELSDVSFLTYNTGTIAAALRMIINVIYLNYIVLLGGVFQLPTAASITSQLTDFQLPPQKKMSKNIKNNYNFYGNRGQQHYVLSACPSPTHSVPSSL